MGTQSSIIANKSNEIVKIQYFSPYLKRVASRKRASIQMAQHINLIWLDNNINDNSTDSANTINKLQQLKQLVNTISMHSTSEECIEFLKNMGDKKACIIVSGSLGQHIVPIVHDMFQVDCIFIFCSNKKNHKQWTKDWSKVKGVFTRISPICQVIKQATKQCTQTIIPMSLMSINEDLSKNSLDRLDPCFMYTQILKEILLTINFEEKHFKEFISYCRNVFAENQDELNHANELEKTYRDETPIWWYTSDYFLYPMLNRALRVMDVDIIIKIGFFIYDLHCHIDKLHKEQFNDPNSDQSFLVYRGQGMSKSEFDEMNNSKGGLISFNNFLSTSKNCTISFRFAQRAVQNSDLMGILFVMKIDPAKSTTPFASINDVSYYKDKEDEVLFAMHTVFRISDIKIIDENLRLYQVELVLTDENDKDLCSLTDQIREETFPDEQGWHRLGSLLIKIGQFDKAEEVYRILLEQTTNEDEKAIIYRQIGSVKNSQGEYEEALQFFEKELEISQKTLPRNHPDLTSSYNNIGLIHFNMGEYLKALSYYKKYLAIQRRSLPSNHLDLAASYNNIGVAYKNLNKHSKAISFHKKALAIQQKLLPSNHPDLAASYGNIGLMYMHMGGYTNALFFLQKTLEIQKQSLPPNHPHFAYSYNNIGLVHEKIGEYAKASTFYESAMNIGQQPLPSNHPDLHLYKTNLDRIKRNYC